MYNYNVMMKIQKTFFAILLTLLMMTAGFAADFTWRGISATWKDQNNWIRSGSIPPSHPGYPSTSSDTAIITSNGQAPVLNTSIPINLNSLTISSGSLTITGNTSLTLSGNFTHNGGTFSAVPNTTVIFNGSNSTIGGLMPTSFANLTVAASGTVKLGQAITVGGTFTNSGNFNTNQKNVTFNGAVINNGTFETYIPMQPAADSQLTFKKNFNNNGSFSADSKNTAIFQGQNSKIAGTGSSLFGNLTVAANPAKLELEKNIKIAGTFTQDGKFLVNDNTTVTFTGANSKIAGYSEPTFFNLTIASGTLKLDRTTVKIKGAFTNNGTFTHNNKTVIFNGLTSKIAGNTETEFYNLAVDANKILHLEQNIIIAAFLENKGIFKAQGNTVTLNPAGTEVKIEGTNTATDTEFAAVSCLGAGGKRLTINGKIMVVNLKIGGASEANKLTVQGGASSEITLTSNQIPDPGTKKGYYLDVNTNIPIANGYTYYVAESVLGNPNPNNWKHMSSTWKTNAANTNWNAASNWTPEVVPAAGWPVIIPAGGTKYPKLTANVKAKTITLAPGAKLDLADYVITKSNLVSDFTPITNNGTLRMKGTSSLTDPKGQKEWLESTVLANQITHGATSVIEYYSTANNPLWQGPYQNLTVSEGRIFLTPINPGSGSNAADLTVEKTFTVAVDAGDNFIVTANSQLYKQTVSLKKKTTFSSFGGTGTVFKDSVSASGIDIAFSGNGLIKTESTVTAKDITVNSGTGAWNSSGKIEATIINTQRNWTSTGNVTANGSITANGWTAKNVTLKGDLTAVQFNQTAGTLTFNGTGTPEQELKFTGAGDKKINHLTIDTGAKVKLGSDITVKGDLTNKGTFNAVTYTVTLTNANHTIKGTSTASATTFRNLSLTNAGGKNFTINGKITVAGNFDISGTAWNNLLNIKGPGEITLGSDQTAAPSSPPQKGYYLNIHTNIPITNGHTYTVRESKATEVSGLLISDGNPKNWIFNDYIGEMKWSAKEANNTDKTKWDKSKNWIPNGIPGVHTKVNIPTGINKYPKLENSTNAKAEKITVEGELDLAGYVITDTLNTAPLTNNGLLKMTGTANQKTWFEQASTDDKITLGSNSTVQYDSGSSANVFSGPYENLILNRSITAGSPLTVNKKTTVNTAATITAPTQTYGGDVRINANTTFSASNSITFSHAIEAAANNVTFDGNGTINTQKLSAADITVNSGTGAWTSSGAITAQNITTNRNWTSTGNITATTGKIRVTGDWNTNSGNITAGTNIEAAKWNSEQGTITAGNDITVTGNWYSERSIISGRNIKTSSGSKWTSWGRITATENIDIKNELAFTGGRITVGGNLAAKKLNAYSNAYSGGLIFFNGSGTQKLSGKGGNNIEGASIQNLQINSGATLQLESDITITVGLDNQGKFDAVTKSKKVKLVHAAGLHTPPDPPNNITIKGNTSAANTKFHNLECTNAGGKALTINGKIFVKGDLKLEGTNDGSLLTIEGGSNSPGIELYIDQTGNGKWLKVHTNVPMIPESSGKTYTVKESNPIGTEQEIYTDKKPKNWIFDDCLIEMKWQGGSGSTDLEKTAWSRPQNWLPNGIPGEHTPKAIIPKGRSYYPMLTGNVYVQSAEIERDEAAIPIHGKIDLSDFVIKKTTGASDFAKLTNSGTIKMTGTADHLAWFGAGANNKIELKDNSTIEYYGSTNNAVWDGPYKNLILGENRANLTAVDLQVDEALTVASNSTDPTITASTQTYKGSVSLQKNTTFSSSGANGTVFNEKIEAAGIDIIFNGNGSIKTKKAVTAKDITVNSGTGAWTSSGAITAQNITVDRNWSSSGDVTAAGNIMAKGWTANNVSLKGNLTAARFNQMTGTLTFNGTGTPEQELNFTGNGNKRINNLTIDNGSTPNTKLKLLSEITIKGDFTNKGTFNAVTHTVTLTNDADHKIIGTDAAGDTKFYNLFCEDAGDKTLTFENKIWVEEKMYLSGSYSTVIKPLNIKGKGNGVISVISLKENHPIPSNALIGNIRQKFLKVWSDEVKINDGKYYGTDESTDDQGTTKNKNGWVFYKTFELVNSFVIPGKNEIYLLFKNGSTDNKYKELTEADLANPNLTPLLITDGAGNVYAENRLHKPEKLSLPSAIKEHTFWKFTLNKSISPDWILNQNAIVSLDYYDRKKEKFHISDIGIDMVTPQRASNSIVLRSFDASEDDKALPRLDVTILAEKKGASNNVQLYFYSKDSVEHKFWHPGTAPIGPPPHFAVPQAGTTNYGCTLENNLLKSIISEQDVHLEPNKVGGFMYIYDGWLPCARLRNSNDILSFDVWHFKIVGVQKQKGGVSIFDNVLDPYKGQETIIAAHLQKPGMLTIQIMSLDGSIIRTIERSYKAAGDHIYFWDGKNNGGNPVARGIYFVRIAGPDIDEVRKILVVKN